MIINRPKGMSEKMIFFSLKESKERLLGSKDGIDDPC